MELHAKMQSKDSKKEIEQVKLFKGNLKRNCFAKNKQKNRTGSIF